MYCKYCGSRIASDATKCLSCGANIDLNDGGQSFFDDNELDAWQSDSVMRGPQTSMPKTEMREPLSDNADFEESQAVASSTPLSPALSKVKNNILDYLNISSPNRLIIFCIASALAIVLLVVAIIAVLSGGKENTDKNESKTNTSGYTQQVEGDVNTDNSQQTTNTENSAENPSEPKQEKDVLKNKTEIKNVKIYDKDGKKISHPVSAYIDENNILYVSLDKILKHEGFKSGRANGNNSNRILYEHKSNGKVIEIEKGTNKIWITKPGENAVTQWLAGDNFNVGDNSYVPIRSFLVKYGYDGDKVKWVAKDNALYFNK